MEECEVQGNQVTPYTEKPVAVEADTEASKAARQRLGEILKELNPQAGKTDAAGGGGQKRPGKGKRKVNRAGTPAP